MGIRHVDARCGWLTGWRDASSCERVRRHRELSIERRKERAPWSEEDLSAINDDNVRAKYETEIWKR